MRKWETERAVWLAWALCALAIVCSVIGFFLASGRQTNIYGVLNNVLDAVTFIVFAVVGALILARLPRHMIGWLLMAIGLGLSTTWALIEYLNLTISHPLKPDFPTYLYLWLSGWNWWLGMGPLFLILLLFPTGHLLSRRWRWVVGWLAGGVAFFIFIATFSATYNDSVSGQSLPGPFPLLLKLISYDVVLIPWAIGLVLLAAMCVASMVIRYRRAGSVERVQLRWFVSVCVLFILVYPTGFLANSSFRKDFFSVTFSTILLLFPISIGIAILRYHLWDIDVIIRRTLTYGALTALLALFYFGSVIVIQEVLRAVVGESSELAIILSTLAIAVLFAPLRRRVQENVDLRFYRRKYDAAQVLQTFGAAVRDEVDLSRLTEELLKAVKETVQPEHANVWMKPIVNGGKVPDRL